MSPSIASRAQSVRAESTELHLSRRRGRKPKYSSTSKAASPTTPASSGKQLGAAIVQTKVRKTLNSLSTESTKKLCSALQAFSKPGFASSTQATAAGQETSHSKTAPVPPGSRKRLPTGRPRGRPRKISRPEGLLAITSSSSSSSFQKSQSDTVPERESTSVTVPGPSSSQQLPNQEEHRVGDYVIYKYFKGNGSKYTCKLCRKVFTKNKQNALKHVECAHGDILREKRAISGSSSASQLASFSAPSSLGLEQRSEPTAAAFFAPSPPTDSDPIPSSDREIDASHFDAPSLSHNSLLELGNSEAAPLSSTRITADSSLTLQLLVSPRAESVPQHLESKVLTDSSGSSLHAEHLNSQNSQEVPGILLMLNQRTCNAL